MDEIEVDSLATPDLDSPVFIEGLPGVGLVGKLAVNQLLEELDSEPIRRIVSEHFPPVVTIDDDGVAELASVTVHAIQTTNRDLLVLAGDGQAQESIGQYRLADTVLDIADELDVGELVTLGGFGTGEQVDDYYVVGATTDATSPLKTRLADAGVQFDQVDAPGNIVGMSGLLVGLGARRGYDAAGLLGITPGYYVDPASARAVLGVLQDTFDFSVSLDTLEEQAEQIQQLLEQLQQTQQQEQPTRQSGEDLRYFG